MQKDANKPVVLQQQVVGGKILTCYTAPGEIFSNEAEMKAHYHSDFHKYNLKRKVTGLGPITRAAFEEREARAPAEQAAAEAGRRLTTAERRMARDERRQQKHEKQLRNPHSKAAHYQATENMSVDDYVRHKMKHAPTFDAGTDLFSRHQCEGANESEKLHANLAHMGRTHGFYVPYLDYCTDLVGLIRYLQEKVYIGNVALCSGKQFHSIEAVQAHMRAKTQCRLELEGNEEELGDFYDLESLADKSPLWEWEEVTDDEEDEGAAGDDAMEVDQRGGGSAGAAAAAAAVAAVESFGFDDLFARALELELLSEAQVDAMTDAVASGAASEAALAAEWRPQVSKAAAAAAAAAAGGEAAGERRAESASQASSQALRVVYRPLGDSSEAHSLQLGNREIGHRSMSSFYKQRFGQKSSALAAVSPELEKLMLQYAKAGVLSSQLQLKLAAPKQKSERTKMVLNRSAKLHMQQGITNNTTMNGMKHFKNQSLMY